jgi:hypothetical protein
VRQLVQLLDPVGEDLDEVLDHMASTIPSSMTVRSHSITARATSLLVPLPARIMKTAVAMRPGFEAPLTLAAGPATLRAGKGSDERGGAMRVGVGAALEEPSA